MKFIGPHDQERFIVFFRQKLGRHQCLFKGVVSPGGGDVGPFGLKIYGNRPAVAL
jgi:hypothetical protein